MVDIAVLGISLQEEDGTPLLLLHPQGSQTILTLDIGAMEAFAISLALHVTSGPRPQTENEAEAKLPPRPTPHELVVNILRALGAKLVCVRLTDFVDNAYIAEAVLSHRGGETVIDCRPSDAIAIALRCGAPVRASAAVAALARDINEVMAILPEHVRTIAAARLTELSLRDRRSGPEACASPVSPRIPKAVEAALSAKLAATGRDPRQELISAARKMMEEERARDREDNASGLEQLLVALGHSVSTRLKTDEPATVQPHREGIRNNTLSGSLSGERRSGPRTPQIRVSLMRHTGDGKTEIVNEFTVPKQNIHIPERVLAGLGLSQSEAEAVNEASDEDRWAMLLRILAPETKVPM
ncbi:MAG: bifunctional nuclease family protein [Desulfovibrionaceae bacterium]|nr:bifunctional nuclease family protein [Desulfovibrionaceae bacterium]